MQAWFKKQNRDDNIRAGRVIFDREWRRLGLPPIELDKLADKVNLAHGVDVLAALGAGDIRIAQLVNAATETIQKVTPHEEAIPTHVTKKPKTTSASDVLIEGVDNLLSHIAGCCKPVPGDKIIGYITQTTGISIHRVDCPNILQINQAKPERLIDVTWTQVEDKRYPVDLRIYAQDRPGLLRDITSIFTQERMNITSLMSSLNPKEGTYTIHCTVEIPGLDSLSRLIDKISSIPYVIDVARQL